MTPKTTHTRFPLPSEVTTPPACAGWEEMYAYHTVFGEHRRDFDDGRFWFQEGLHFPEPYYPFDAWVLDSVFVAFSQASARLFVIPPSRGVDYRLLNGYVYAS